MGNVGGGGGGDGGGVGVGDMTSGHDNHSFSGNSKTQVAVELHKQTG